MFKNFRKLLLLFILFIPFTVFAYSNEKTVKIEFEKAELTDGARIRNSTDASGGQYAYDTTCDEYKRDPETNLPTNECISWKYGTITVTYNAEKEGFYNLTISTAHNSSKNKVQMLFINDEYQGDFTFNPASSSTDFHEVDLGTIKLKKGDNKITIKGKYYFQSYDYLLITPIDDIEPTSSTEKLIDPNATAETVCLFNYLNSIYGKYTLSGQQEYHEDSAERSREQEFNYIKEKTGKLPAIRGFDLSKETNPMYKVKDDGLINRIKEWVLDKGGIATISIDLRVPEDINKYINNTYSDDPYGNATPFPAETNFDISNVFKENTGEKKYIDEFIKNIADKLKELEEAKIPVILRLMQESEGNGGVNGTGAWFWYGGQGNENFIKLYRYFVDELKNTYKLHNIIYTTTVYNTPNNSELWYPGDNYLDIIGYDRYTKTLPNPEYSPATSTFYNLIKTYSNKKMFSMAENDSIISSKKMKEEKSQWLYFLTWYGDYLMNEEHNTPEQLRETYNAENVITLDELPDYRNMCFKKEEQEEKKEETTNKNDDETKEEKIVNPPTGTFLNISLILIASIIAIRLMIIAKRHNKFNKI